MERRRHSCLDVFRDHEIDGDTLLSTIDTDWKEIVTKLERYLFQQNDQL